MRKLAIHAALLLTALVAFASHEWGTVVHSAIGIGIGLVVAYHVGRHRTWIRSVWRRRGAHPESRLGVFNAAFATVFAVCTVTGFPLWSDAPGEVVVRVHDLTAIAFTLMVFGHVFLNRRRIRTWVRARRRRPAAAASAAG